MGSISSIMGRVYYEIISNRRKSMRVDCKMMIIIIMIIIIIIIMFMKRYPNRRKSMRDDDDYRWIGWWMG